MDRVALIILAVHDLAGSVRFYREAFDWPLAVDEPAYAEFETGGFRLGLYQREGYRRNFETAAVAEHPGEGVTATEIYLYSESVEATFERLRKAGARVLSPAAQRPWGDRCAYVSDPDGNVIAVAERGRP